MISERKARKLAKLGNQITAELGRTVGLDAWSTPSKQDKKNAEVWLEITRIGSHFMVIFSDSDLFPAVDSQTKKAGAKLMSKALDPTTGQRASVFLAYAFTTLAASAGDDATGFHQHVRDGGLPSVFPLNTTERNALERCTLVWQIGASGFQDIPGNEDDWLKLPPAYCLALQAGARGAELARAVGENHEFFAWDFFTCEATKTVIGMLIGDERFRELEPALLHADMRSVMPPMLGGDGMVEQAKLLKLWNLQLKHYAELTGTPVVTTPPPPSPG